MDEESKPPVLDDVQFWGGFFTIIALFLAYVFFRVRKINNASFEPDVSMFTVEAELPDTTEYNKIKSERPDRMGPEFDKWHEKAVECLAKRARDGLRPFHMARKRLNEFHVIRENAGKVGLNGAVHEETWKSAQQALAACMQEIADVEKEARWLQPGAPGWEAGVFQEATDALRAENEAWKERQAKKKAEKAALGNDGECDDTEEDEVQKENSLWLSALRFKVGDRVACNMGQRGFVPGFVVGNWRLPYVVSLDTGERVTAPGDNDQLIRAYKPDPQNAAAVKQEEHILKHVPKEVLALWAPFRFKPGDRIEINMGPEQGWQTGTIIMQNWRNPKWPPNQFAAYQVKIDTSDNLVFTPRDHPNFVRALNQ